MPPVMLTPLMAGFVGVFLYIGACELVPRCYALNLPLRTTLASIAGKALMFVVTSNAHGHTLPGRRRGASGSKPHTTILCQCHDRRRV